jgi:hypothetical protein
LQRGQHLEFISAVAKFPLNPKFIMTDIELKSVWWFIVLYFGAENLNVLAVMLLHFFEIALNLRGAICHLNDNKFGIEDREQLLTVIR